MLALTFIFAKSQTDSAKYSEYDSARARSSCVVGGSLLSFRILPDIIALAVVFHMCVVIVLHPHFGREMERISSSSSGERTSRRYSIKYTAIAIVSVGELY